MKPSKEEWLIEQKNFSDYFKYESCFTTANGYMGVRGTSEENFDCETNGTFIAGIFDKSDAQVSQLVNMPYFFALEFYINNEKINLMECKILEFYRALDMKQGILYMKIKIQDKSGRITKIEGYRFCSHGNKHLAGIHYEFVPCNYNAKVSVKNIIDANTINGKHTVCDNFKHYSCVKKVVTNYLPIYIEVETRQKKYRVGMAASLKITKDKVNAAINKKAIDLGDRIQQIVQFNAVQQETYSIEKYVSVVTSRDIFDYQIQERTNNMLMDFLSEGIENELKKSILKLNEIWSISDIEIEGDDKAQKALRFNIYTLSTVINEEDKKISIGAKGLHGEGYNGHVFWDTEVFMLPFYIYNNPEAAKSLLLYRYNTLNAARTYANSSGNSGARYPWESSDTGVEETPEWMSDYKGNSIRVWTGDIEYHISSDVAFAVWQYVRATDDIDFLLNYGIEIILETARFWTSRVEYNERLDRYEINDVIGPDEFHEHVNNNTYTNYMAKWNINKGLELLNLIKIKYTKYYEKIIDKICLTTQEINRWNKVVDKIYIPKYNNELIFEQHEGYFKLKDFTITQYDKNNMPIFPKEVDATKLNDYTLIKQADIVMLLYILGEYFSNKVKKNNFEYYEKRTTHKSSLSASVYCILGLTVGDYQKSYEYLMRTALVDIADNQGNGCDGLHLASAGGTWQAAVFGFGGVNVNNKGMMCFNPTWMPEIWKKFSYKICWKGLILNINITKESIEIDIYRGNGKIKIDVCGQEYLLSNDKKITVKFKNKL